ncbi:hypothetical protein [Bacteroides pyogenes]|uniref:hypothetical protein n=1 Tax=Bacteroides pyogenes TaxID=310300 RepID=UPI001BAA0EF7|nr:hypothetical protein [Bacteroides pyogenes]
MAKVQNLSDIQQEIAFTEFDFYRRYEETFKSSELGRIKSHLPLGEMALSFGLIDAAPKSIRVKRGRKCFFTPEGKVAFTGDKMNCVKIGVCRDTLEVRCTGRLTAFVCL